MMTKQILRVFIGFFLLTGTASGNPFMPIECRSDILINRPAILSGSLGAVPELFRCAETIMRHK